MKEGIRNAIWALWASIGIGALLSVIDLWTGAIGESEFLVTLFLYGLLCIIPYKIEQGSNAARYVFLVSVAMSVLILIGTGRGEMSLVSFVGSVLLIPVDIYILLKLFGADSKDWFTQNS